MTGNKSCKLASSLASDACERSLTLNEWLRLRLHLLMCESCRNCEREIHLLHDVLALIQRKHGTFKVDLPQKDRELIRDALRDITNE
ncbi:MAG: hypothetical protein Q9M27_00415 [Mariprofundaceae bacterium]|nr:hypothetical protein [Mariprofundaceae bacterium]